MDLGFDTVGNATLIAYDRGPVVVTDPWLDGDAYFGSWALSHAVPDEQQEAALAAPFVWLSHGHPDHLHGPTLERLRGKQVLLPDHVGGRIATGLRDAGHRVLVLPDRRWTSLSERIAVCSVADYNQDGILLVRIGDRLVVDLNDASDHGWRSFVRSVVADHDVSFHLQLVAHGDADMCNVFDTAGNRLTTGLADRPLAPSIAAVTGVLGTRYFVPFSAMHTYQRRDSIWANDLTTPLDAYGVGTRAGSAEILSPFLRYDCVRDEASPIDPEPRPRVVRDPEEFGDDWSEALEAEEVAAVRRYFAGFAHLPDHFAAIDVEVGGRPHRVVEGTRHARRGPSITFHAPRRSLVDAVRWEVFDDLLIANFMRTTVDGGSASALYPHFSPYVAKYGDNGLARTRDELAAYFAAYRKRAPFDYLRHRLDERAKSVVRTVVPPGRALDRGLRRAYHGRWRAIGRGRSLSAGAPRPRP